MLVFLSGGNVIDETVSPGFPWFGRLDDGMSNFFIMFAGVFIGRIIAAADMSASEANSQVDPTAADF